MSRHLRTMARKLEPTELVVYAAGDDVVVQRYATGPIGDVRIVRGRHEIAVVLQSDIEIKYAADATPPEAGRQ
jgi:hypothetical protein